jgi:peptidoglycan L-alanyl-D-glutamate endopeptidase CwlK
MAAFGTKSRKVLAELHPDIQSVLTEAIKSDYFDFSLMEGIRSPERQNELFAGGESKAKAGESAHNYSPSFAFDCIPHPSGYKDGQAMLLLAGHILSTADRLGVKLTCGCDWDRDGIVMDTNFKDFWHFELTNWRDMR